ncbi:MAG: hypothetical protein MUO22_04535, partial [Sedimentisphaerales bacterium]|nr:hypothetical protein [Sedimentisphaerales bacterium]
MSAGAEQKLHLFHKLTKASSLFSEANDWQDFVFMIENSGKRRNKIITSASKLIKNKTTYRRQIYEEKRYIDFFSHYSCIGLVT